MLVVIYICPFQDQLLINLLIDLMICGSDSSKYIF